MESQPARLDLSLYPEPPTQLLTPTSGFVSVNLREVWQSYELLFSLARRDVRARYKQTALGAFWILAHPLLAVLIVAFWHLPGWSILLMPFCVALLWALALGIGLCAAAVAVSYRDALYVLPVLTQFLMWGSAVLFPTDRVPQQYQWILYLNPLVSLIEVFRWSVLGVGSVRWDAFGYSAGFAGLVLLCGMIAFRRLERSFADFI